MAPIDKQDVVRMNRDTLYSSGVFDLDAAPVTVTLPDAGKRFMSMQVISQDHYTTEVVYAPGRFTYTKDKVGTRYVYVIIRTLVNPEDPRISKAAQRAAGRDQGRAGEHRQIRGAELGHGVAGPRCATRSSVLGCAAAAPATCSARRSEVDPVAHLIGTAIGWGGNPRQRRDVSSASIRRSNDGKTVYTLTVKDVPVDGFWSISVYNAKGFFEKNALERLFAQQPDGEAESRRLVHDPVRRLRRKATPNCLPIVAGLELHRAPLSPAQGNPRWNLEAPGSAAGVVMAAGRVRRANNGKEKDSQIFLAPVTPPHSQYAARGLGLKRCPRPGDMIDWAVKR